MARKAHISVYLHAVEQLHAVSGQHARSDLVPGHAPRLPFAAHARSDHEIRNAGTNGIHEGPYGLHIVGPIAIHENDDVGIRGRLRRQQAGAAIASPDVKDLRARSLRTRAGVVAASTVRDDDTADDVARNGTHDGADRSRLIERRNDEDHRACRLRHAAARTVARLLRPGHHGQRLQRSPQLAHAAGGLSDSSASRND